MLKFLWLYTWKDYQSETKSNNQDILPLSKLNLFIGRNNSGKSRFLRYFADCNTTNLLCLDETDNIFSYKETLEMIKKVIPEGNNIDKVRGNDLKALLSKDNYLTHNDREFIKTLPQGLSAIKSDSWGRSSLFNTGEITSLLNQNSEEIEKIIENLTYPTLDRINTIYIPILRGMRPLTPKPSTPYIDRTRKDYFGGNPEKSEVDEIISGEHLYTLLTEYLLGLPEQRQKIKQYEEYLSSYFFEGETVTLIPKHDEDVINVKIGNEPQSPIYKLGDGLQQIIIITSSVFLTENFSYVIIEEPEICLHPGLLRQLMNFLLQQTKHQYFVTTHSNHLLDFVDENNNTVIHKMKKISGGESPKFKVTTIKNDRSLLLDLGVKSSSVYLANCTIWVEGITDRLYLKSYMRGYLNYLKQNDAAKYSLLQKNIENYHYSFVEYQGGNLSHWSFSEEESISKELKAVSVSTPILLIADGDIKNKSNRVDSLKEQLKTNFYLLPCKEIENLIPDSVLISSAKELFIKFKRETYGVDISKLDKIQYEDYANSDNGVGFHLDKKIGLRGKGRKGTHLVFADNSGTVKDKMKLCEVATNFMDNNDWELTEPIIDICEKIFEHIKTNNTI